MFNGEVRQYDELKKEETGVIKPKSFMKKQKLIVVKKRSQQKFQNESKVLRIDENSRVDYSEFAHKYKWLNYQIKLRPLIKSV